MSRCFGLHAWHTQQPIFHILNIFLTWNIVLSFRKKKNYTKKIFIEFAFSSSNWQPNEIWRLICIDDFFFGFFFRHFSYISISEYPIHMYIDSWLALSFPLPASYTLATYVSYVFFGMFSICYCIPMGYHNSNIIHSIVLRKNHKKITHTHTVAAV